MSTRNRCCRDLTSEVVMSEILTDRSPSGLTSLLQSWGGGICNAEEADSPRWLKFLRLHNEEGLERQTGGRAREHN